LFRHFFEWRQADFARFAVAEPHAEEERNDQARKHHERGYGE